jgi:hypothetical protein
MKVENVQGNIVTAKPDQGVLLNRIAIIVSSLDKIEISPEAMPSIYHIYLVNSRIVSSNPQNIISRFPSSHITPLTGIVRTLAGVIKEDIVKRKLTTIVISQTDTDEAKQIATLAEDLKNLDINFAMCAYNSNSDRPEHQISGGIRSMENCWANIPAALDVTTIPIDMLIGQLGVPAILVGSGPSLNKNIDELKRVYEAGSALIIACGSAIGPLTKKGIAPHMVISIDPFPLVSEQLLDSEVVDVIGSNTILLASLSTDRRLVENWPGPRIMFTRPYDKRDLVWMCDEIGFKVQINSSATVSTAALFAALNLGCNPIVFVGHDLAFEGIFKDENEQGEQGEQTEGQAENQSGYTGKAYADNVKALQGIGAQRICRITDIWGNIRLTDWAYKEVWDFFCSFVPQIREHDPNRIIINATEGGAGIKGADHCKLSEVDFVGYGAELKSFVPELAANMVKAQEAQGDRVDVRRVASKINDVYKSAGKLLVAIKRFAETLEIMHGGEIEQKADDGAARLAVEQSIYGKIERFFEKLPTYQAYPFIKTYIDAVLYWTYAPGNDTVGNKIKALFLAEALVVKLRQCIEEILTEGGKEKQGEAA